MDIEYIFLNLLFKNPNNFQAVNERKITADVLFNKLYRNFFIICYKFFHKYKKFPVKAEFEFLLNSLGIDAELVRKLNELYDTLSNEPASSVSIDYIIDELKKVYSITVVSETLDTARTDIQAGNINAVIDSVQRSLYRVKMTLEEEIKEGNLSDSVDSRKSQYIETKKTGINKGIQLGFPSFDAVTYGVRPGELMVVMSGTGEGKSVFLINAANYVYNVLNKNVFFVSIENPKEQVERRLDAVACGLDYNKIKNGGLSQEEEMKYFEFLEEQKKRTNKFYIYDNTACTVEDIYIKYNELKPIFKPDIIFVDYLGIIKYQSRSKNSWEDVGNVALELKKLARVFQVPVITATQVEREAQKNRKDQKYNIPNVALSLLIMNHSDIVLSLKINNPELLDMSPICDITGAIVKNRDGGKGLFTIYANFSEIKMSEKIIKGIV